MGKADFQTITDDATPALARYRKLWDLTPDGDPFATPSSLLQPVMLGERKAMLKLPFDDEERRGMRALAWYGGLGAALVLRIDGEACLIERLADDQPLTAMAQGGQDDAATEILVDAAMRLHAPRDGPLPDGLPSLHRWFQELREAAGEPSPHQALFQAGLTVTEQLFEAPDRTVLLHGDIHHANVLHDPARGWLAIDAKGVIGDRGYDFANMLCNPLGAFAQAPGRLQRQAQIVAGGSGRPLERVLQWVVAYSALSVAWTFNSQPEQAEEGFAMARLAQAALADVQ
jgi:streptomycin 6-kinase